MNLTHLLDRHRTERGDKAALIEAERTVTYAELYDQVTRMAGFLESRGLRRGSRVLVFVPMSVDLYVILLGILHLGAVAVFVEQAMGRKQLEAALGSVEAEGRRQSPGVAAARPADRSTGV